eukprot:1003429-Pyramimonas_sp.AAC.1
MDATPCVGVGANFLASKEWPFAGVAFSAGPQGCPKTLACAPGFGFPAVPEGRAPKVSSAQGHSRA